MIIMISCPHTAISHLFIGNFVKYGWQNRYLLSLHLGIFLHVSSDNVQFLYHERVKSVISQSLFLSLSYLLEQTRSEMSITEIQNERRPFINTARCHPNITTHYFLIL